MSHVHLLLCRPSYFPFSEYSQGEHCAGCQPQQPCRLSVRTSTAATETSGFDTTPASCGASALLSEASSALLNVYMVSSKNVCPVLPKCSVLVIALCGIFLIIAGLPCLFVFCHELKYIWRSYLGFPTGRVTC